MFFILFTKFLKTRSDSYFRNKTIATELGLEEAEASSREINRLYSTKSYSIKR